MTIIKQIILGISVTAMFGQATSAAPADAQNFEAMIANLTLNVEVRAAQLARESDIRTLDLRQRSLERELAEVELRVRTIAAMATKRGEMYSVSKEFVFSEANFLLFGCYAIRLLVNERANDAETPTPPPFGSRVGSVLCLVTDAATAGVAAAVATVAARIAKPVRMTVREALMNPDVPNYPKSARLLRSGAFAFGGLSLVQTALTWAYADELNYRSSIDNLSPAGVTTELQKQLKTANELGRELAAVQLAKSVIVESLKTSQQPAPRAER